MDSVVVYKNRTNTLRINLGIDVSSDTFTSQIRNGKLPTSPLLATWTVSFVTNGVNGQLVCTLDDSATTSALIAVKSGYMDLRRVSGGEPVPVFDSPIKVIFKESITV